MTGPAHLIKAEGRVSHIRIMVVQLKDALLDVQEPEGAIIAEGAEARTATAPLDPRDKLTVGLEQEVPCVVLLLIPTAAASLARRAVPLSICHCGSERRGPLASNKDETAACV